MELQERTSLTADLGRACALLFKPPQEDLVRCLCVQLGYVNLGDADSLGVLRYDVDHDPLDLFKLSKSNDQRSRFETLFIEDDSECISLRQLFFRNTVINTAADNRHVLVATLESLANSLRDTNREEQASFVQEVLVAVRNIYSQVCLPKFPSTLTEDTAWSTLRNAWSDENYLSLIHI